MSSSLRGLRRAVANDWSPANSRATCVNSEGQTPSAPGGSTGDSDRRSGTLQIARDPTFDREPASACRYHRLVQRIEVKGRLLVGARGECGEVFSKLRGRFSELGQSAFMHECARSPLLFGKSRGFRGFAGARNAEHDQTAKPGQFQGGKLFCLVLRSDGPDPVDIPVRRFFRHDRSGSFPDVHRANACQAVR